MKSEGRIIRADLYDNISKSWLHFVKPKQIISTNRVDQVLECLKEVDFLVNSQRLNAVGFITFGASPAFDPTLSAKIDHELPLIWFALYEDYQTRPAPTNCDSYINNINWQSAISTEKYNSAFKKIKTHIKRGDTYQVNYTYPLSAEFNQDTWNFFNTIAQAQTSNYPAYIDLEKYVICSASPELFFSLDGEHIVTKPMKGTSKRGLTYQEDALFRDRLKSSKKTRAENIMITDMMRNDLSKIADKGSVEVVSLCDIEQYPTVWQMTSTIHASTQASILEIFKALFPCSSITGAPKKRTMDIIKKLEHQPRGLYTGAIGYIFPDRKSQFSVAIRTAVINKEKSLATYGVGGGIVWDSDPREEFEESKTKSKVLITPSPQFQLLESLLWSRKEGFFLLAHHLRRLRESASYFNYKYVEQEIIKALNGHVEKLDQSSYKVRLLVYQDGQHQVTSSKIVLEESKYPPLQFCLADTPISKENLFLYHKTTHREIYYKHKSKHAAYDDVVLFNKDGHITECCNFNVVIKTGGRLITPPITCGLLAGTFRASLLEEKKIEEGLITIDDLKNADKIFAINSVRKWREAEIVTSRG